MGGSMDRCFIDLVEGQLFDEHLGTVHILILCGKVQSTKGEGGVQVELDQSIKKYNHNFALMHHLASDTLFSYPI